MLAVAVAIFSHVPANAAIHGSCDDLLPTASASTAPRLVTANDLVRLRDYGMVGDAFIGRSPVTASPDGRRVALLIRRADPDANLYCQGLVVVDIAYPSTARLVDRGGDFIRYRIPSLRGAIVPSGTADIITPAWSPDGRWIAYRKSIAGHVQGWIARADGGGAHAAIVSEADVDAIAWSDDGRTLIYSTWSAFIDAERAIDAEGRGGWLYDRRTIPLSGARPFPQQPLLHSYFAVAIDGGVPRSASLIERSRLDRTTDPSWPAGAAAITTGRDGNQAWVAPDDPSRALAPARLWLRHPGQSPIQCAFNACAEKVVEAWWSPDGRHLRFLRREGWADSLFAFYDWVPGVRPPRRTFSTEDVFSNCQPIRNRLLCSRDASREPRRVVLLDPRTGRWRSVFDPNPEFAHLRLGTVTRLHWRTAFGTPCYGDLVLPPDHRDGERHPLIMVQYRTKGFLRGAVGDQYPIQAFAARGYAVLSVERTPSWAETHALPGDRRSFDDLTRDDQAEWIDRRNMLSALTSGIDLVVHMGVAEGTRVGITGVSEAAMSTWFALDTSDRFKVASVGSCCMDPKTTLVVGGEAWAADLTYYGYPDYTADPGRYWAPMSLAMNADHVTVPILMQLSDDEFILGLEAYESLREKGRAVEMRVFPGEHHYEWQPAHRFAIYERNLDWFDFWMRGIEDPAPTKRAQYAGWRSLRSRAGCTIANAVSASVCSGPATH